MLRSNMKGQYGPVLQGLVKGVCGAGIHSPEVPTIVQYQEWRRDNTQNQR